MGDVWFGEQNPLAVGREAGVERLVGGLGVGRGGGARCRSRMGTETLGSIVSPSTACGTTGLRPTFGRK